MGNNIINSHQTNQTSENTKSVAMAQMINSNGYHYPLVIKHGMHFLNSLPILDTWQQIQFLAG